MVIFLRVALPAVILTLCGCFGAPPTIVASTSPLPPGVAGTIPAFGDNCQYNLLGLLPVTRSPNSQLALDDAKNDAGVDVLTDVTIDNERSYYILFSTNCVKVRGKGVAKSVTDRLKANVRGSM